ncbi:YchJ family protein [Cryobacterium sp. PH31-L1]|uniref:YchJ family protein n=1 Tax=Cryobacterium sp. PH31-L1 TaxID=3046199 RepID=UPI0024B90B2C|nr:YchJ family protein [Cryobacterium sp. PH31-L1]MDJ0377905.1 YchJ family protein [Cryobacterium sp. PH31-L1]
MDPRCPCLSGDTYSACCGRFHSGTAVPPTAEWLMRSRYSAFCRGDAQYLLHTWHPLTRPQSVELDSAISWRRLDIVRTERGGLFDREGVVEFTAHYREDGIAGQQNEVSRFLKVDRQWYYLDADPDSLNFT